MLRISLSIFCFIIGLSFALLDDYYHSVICLSIGCILFTYSLNEDFIDLMMFGTSRFRLFNYFIYVLNCLVCGLYAYLFWVSFDAGYEVISNVIIGNVFYLVLMANTILED